MGSTGRNRQLGWIGLASVVVCAVVLGNLVGNERWLPLAFLVAAAFAMLWPIELALGAYAFLLPFASIAVIGESQSGTTVNWVFGALAAIALLGTGLIRQCLELPPLPARIWIVLLLWSLTTYQNSMPLRNSSGARRLVRTLAPRNTIECSWPKAARFSLCENRICRSLRRSSLSWLVSSC
jgi:hypothetical protein